MAYQIQDDYRHARPCPVAASDLLAIALDSANVGVWEVDITAGIVTQSDTVGPLFGLPRGAPHRTVQEWRACIHPEDREASRSAFEGAVEGDGHYRADYRVVWPDGSVHWLSSTGRIFLAEDGIPYRAVGILEDVTDRKRAEQELVRRTQELAESEAQYRTMGEAIPYGVWLCDANGGARYVSPSFLELLEMTQEEQAEFGWTERYDPETKKAMMDRWMHCVRTGELWEYEHRILGPDKQYHTVLSRGRPVRDDKGNITSWVGVNLDITDRKRAENEVLRKNEELQRLLARIRELNEAKSIFFANVSHELRTPLALILGPVDKLLSQEPMPEQREELLVVRRNAATLLKQVNALLDLSKIDAGKMALHYERIDLAELVRLVAGHFDGLARQRVIDYRIDVPDHLPVEIDPEKIERVLLNLLSNAFKFVSDGGRVFCSVRGEEGSARIVVRDNGPGIPAEDRERIFQRFGQGRATGYRMFGGSGLGLAIAHDFVDLHGGTIRVGEAPEGGAEFQVTIPLRAPKDAVVIETGQALAMGKGIVEETGDDGNSGGESTASAVAETPTPMGELDGQPTVLVVEDNADLRRHLVAGLADRWRVIAAADGADGLQTARAVRPDAIVTDLMMPRMSGDDMIHELRGDEALAAIPIIVLSAKADDALRLRLLSGSVQDYLIKPFATEELRARVANLIELKRARDILQVALDSAHDDLGKLAQEIADRNRDLQVAAEAMRVARDQARRGLEVKATFLRMISHELRTPLAALELQIALLKRDRSARLTDHQEAIVEVLAQTVDHLSRMIEEVLTYTRTESGRLEVRSERFDLRALVDQNAERARGAALSKGLVIEVHAPEQAPVWSDPALVGLVLRNLIDNAVKFTVEGRVDLTIAADTGGWSVAVRDTGPGIPVEEQARIFEPFVTLEEVQQKHSPGVGLGLALVRQVVEALGGSIGTHSEPGCGSVFTVLIPNCYAGKDG